MGSFGAKRLQSVDDSFSAMVQPEAMKKANMMDGFVGIDKSSDPVQENQPNQSSD